MSAENSVQEIEIFKEVFSGDNIASQIYAVRSLSAIVTNLGLDIAKTDLFPCLLENIELLHDEVTFHLAEQLENIVPLFIKDEAIQIILDLLAKLSKVDETVVRDRAVMVLKHVCELMSNEECNQHFFTLIESLVSNDWFSTKCSAAPLFAICYPKMTEDKQKELVAIFKTLLQDDTPMVRRASESGLIDFISVLSPEVVKADFVPILDSLTEDEQDSVRILSVDVAIAIVKRLELTNEERAALLIIFKGLTADVSWRVRQRIAFKSHEILQSLASNSEKFRHEVFILYQNCVKDTEAEVRAVASNNLFNFVTTLKSNFSNDTDFEKFFSETIMSLIHFMITDENDDVRLGLSANILTLSTILTNECFNSNVLPLVLDTLENDETMPFKENMLKNINLLPSDVDISKSFKSIHKVVKNLLENSKLHWRARRNLLVAFIHISRNTTADFFDENLKIFFLHLLSDPVFAIRRTSCLIIPLLIKQFGYKWAKASITPILIHLSNDNRYLYRHVALFGIEEIIWPSLDLDYNNNEEDGKYLTSLKNISSHPRALYRIIKLNERLAKTVEAFNLEITEDLDSYTSSSDLKIYAEDTLDTLKKNQLTNIFSVTDQESICYLETILVILNKDFLPVIGKILDSDPSENVKNRARSLVNNLKLFVNALNKEQEQDWVRDALKELSEEVKVELDQEIEEELKAELTNGEEEEKMNLDEVKEEELVSSKAKEEAS